VIEVILEVWSRREQIRGMHLTYEAPFLRHFTARLEPIAAGRPSVVVSENVAARG
jgi:tryptophanase